MSICHHRALASREKHSLPSGDSTRTRRLSPLNQTEDYPMTTVTASHVELCPNCKRPHANHRPWCAKYQTIADPPKAGDIVDDPFLGPTPLIVAYSRQQAIDDGILVDCTMDPFDELNRHAGVSFDVAMTRAVFERYVEV